MEQVEPKYFLIAFVGPSTNTVFMRVLQPMREELSDFLLRRSDQHPSLLFI